MLDVFAEKDVRVTLFFLAWVARRFRRWCVEAVAAGHELRLAWFAA